MHLTRKKTKKSTRFSATLSKEAVLNLYVFLDPNLLSTGPVQLKHTIESSLRDHRVSQVAQGKKRCLKLLPLNESFFLGNDRLALKTKSSHFV